MSWRQRRGRVLLGLVTGGQLELAVISITFIEDMTEEGSSLGTVVLTRLTVFELNAAKDRFKAA